LGTALSSELIGGRGLPCRCQAQSNAAGAATDYWKLGRLAELHNALFQDAVSDQARAQLGPIHPSLMDGENLPDYERAEVEIARIELASTTCDVIGLRARPDPQGICCQVVDLSSVSRANGR
jgi:hypothetical protein